MSEDIEYDYMFKLLLIGDTNTEKSTLLTCFSENSLNDNFVKMIGPDFVSIKMI